MATQEYFDETSPDYIEKMRKYAKEKIDGLTKEQFEMLVRRFPLLLTDHEVPVS